MLSSRDRFSLTSIRVYTRARSLMAAMAWRRAFSWAASPLRPLASKDVVPVLFLVPLVALGLIQQVEGLADAAANVPHILPLDRVVGGQHREQRPVDVAHGLGGHRVVLAPQLLLGHRLGPLLAEDPLQGRLLLDRLAVGPVEGQPLDRPAGPSA